MRQKGFAPILIILVVLIAIGGAYYFGTQKGKIFPTSTQPPTLVATGTPTQLTPTTKPTADPTANWKTFQDTKSGVEFKYPQDWYARQVEGWAFSVFLENHPFEIPEASELLTSISMSFNESMNTVTNIKSFDEKTLEEGITRILGQFNPNDRVLTRNIIIGGRKAAQISGTLAPGMLEGEYFKYTIVQMDGHLLFISLHGHQSESIYNQILSTFKFTQ